MPFDKRFCQQHGFIHAGVITALVDTACGYAAQTLMAEGKGVLTVEFKSNFLSPAVGDSFIAIGKVMKAGRTISVTSGEVYGETNGQRKLVSVMQATMMSAVSDT
jgi:uncharacterized protein (TIGR00369 family)